MVAVVNPIGERLDQLAKRLYGSEKGGKVEALLAANPGLAALGERLTGGTVVATPRVVPAADTDTAVWE